MPPLKSVELWNVSRCCHPRWLTFRVPAEELAISAQGQQGCACAARRAAHCAKYRNRPARINSKSAVAAITAAANAFPDRRRRRVFGALPAVRIPSCADHASVTHSRPKTLRIRTSNPGRRRIKLRWLRARIMARVLWGGALVERTGMSKAVAELNPRMPVILAPQEYAR